MLAGWPLYKGQFKFKDYQLSQSVTVLQYKTYQMLPIVHTAQICEEKGLTIWVAIPLENGKYTSTYVGVQSLKFRTHQVLPRESPSRRGRVIPSRMGFWRRRRQGALQRDEEPVLRENTDSHSESSGPRKGFASKPYHFGKTTPTNYTIHSQLHLKISNHLQRK